MPNYVVLRASAGQVPALQTVGSADVYRGTHTTTDEAAVAAATAWRTPAGTFLYVILESNAERHLVSVAAPTG